LEILREVGDRVGEGATLKNFAELGAAQGDFAEALALGRQAVAVLEKTEDEQTLAEARALVAEWERQAEGQKSKGAER
jgi:DNA-binding XRE family transcriptional regulator